MRLVLTRACSCAIVSCSLFSALALLPSTALALQFSERLEQLSASRTIADATPTPSTQENFSEMEGVDADAQSAADSSAAPFEFVADTDDISNDEPQAALLLQLSAALAAQQAETPTSDEAGRVIVAAMNMLGTPYRYGRDSSEAVDCSGLMRRVFSAVGQHLPRTTKEMLASGRNVGRGVLHRGDLLFYRWQRRQLHVAVYIDDNTIIHASPKAGRVVVTEMTPGWRQRLIAARRLF